MNIISAIRLKGNSVRMVVLLWGGVGDLGSANKAAEPLTVIMSVNYLVTQCNPDD